MSNRCAQQKSLHKCTIVGDKQPQKSGHFRQRTSSKKSSATLTVIGLKSNRAVYIAFSKFSEPKRFVQHLNKVESIFKNNNQINSPVTTRTAGFFRKDGAERFQVQD